MRENLNSVVVEGVIKEINFFGIQVNIDLQVEDELLHVLVLFDHHIDMLEAQAGKGNRIRVVGQLKTRKNKYDVFIQAEYLSIEE